MKNKTHILKFGILVLLIAFVVFLARHVGVDTLLEPSLIKERILGFGVWAGALYVLLYVVATVAFIPGTPFTVAGGAVFGPVFGTLYTVIGATIGATLAFVLARFLGRGFVGGMESEKFKKLMKYDKKMEENGLGTVLLLRFVPLFPFNGLNFALGLTRVSFKDYFLGTLFGIIPGTFAYTYFGDSITSLDPLQITFALALLIALSFAANVFNKSKKMKP